MKLPDILVPLKHFNPLVKFFFVTLPRPGQSERETFLKGMNACFKMSTPFNKLKFHTSECLFSIFNTGVRKYFLHSRTAVST